MNDVAHFDSGWTRGARRIAPSRTCEPEDLSTELVFAPDFESLKKEWSELEARSDASFFTSWSWIGCWLSALNGTVELRLLRAKSQGRTVGLGLVVPHRIRRHGFIVSQQWHLHTTGRPEQDSLTIECNGFLVSRCHAESISAQMFEALARRDQDWDELVLNGMSTTPPWPISGTKLKRQLRVETNHFIDLNQVRDRAGDYLGMLGSKTRARIRQALREYQKIGPIRLEPVRSVDEALAQFEGLKLLHQQHWVSRGEPGAFANPFFEHFHRRLICQSFDSGAIQLLVIRSGQRVLGYLYNFVYRGHVYFYQSGFDYELSARYNQPGLVAIALAVEYNATQGHHLFDLLAGDAHYKQRLGTHSATMAWVTLQRDRLSFRVEDAARGLRKELINWTRARGMKGDVASRQADS
jgi:CelD/BcsL family acetyltransferase involved in cellulose biosynthesis